MTSGAYLVRAARWCGWLTWGTLVLSALTVLVAAVFLSQLSRFRPEVEAAIAGAIGAPIHVAGVAGGLRGLDPYIRLEGVRWVGVPAAGVKEIEVGLDTVRSLRHFVPVLESVKVSGVRLSLERSTDGQWLVNGQPLPQRSGESTMDPHVVSHLAHVSARDVQLLVTTPKGRQQLATPDGVLLHRDGGMTRLTGVLTFEEVADSGSSRAVELIGRYEGTPFTDEFEGRFYVHVDPLQVAGFLPSGANLALRAAEIGGEGWVSFREGRFEASASVVIPGVAIGDEGAAVDVLQDFTAKIGALGSGAADWHLVVDRIAFRAIGKNWRLDPLWFGGLMNRQGEPIVVGKVGNVDLEAAADAVLELTSKSTILPERTGEIVAAMRPRGSFESVYLVLEGIGAGADALRHRSRLVGKLDAVSTDAYLGSPAIDEIEGYASAGAMGGYLTIRGESMTLHFPTQFEQPWFFDRTLAQLRYEYRPGFLQLASERLILELGEMKVQGAFRVNLPRDRRLQTWGLKVGIVGGQLREKTRYLPMSIPETTFDWVDRAVVDGGLVRSGMLFHGALHKDAGRFEKANEMYFDVVAATLDYDAAWPPVEDLEGLIYIGTWGARSDQMAGTIYSGRIGRATVDLPLDIEGATSFVTIAADYESDAGDGIRFLKETPLAEQLDHVADTWSASGALKAEVALAIPLGPMAETADPMTEFSLHLTTTDLTMGAFDLLIEDLTMGLTYGDRSGLNAPAFMGRLFREPIRGSIETFRKGGRQNIVIDFDGTAGIDALYEWSRQTILTRADGQLQYTADLTIETGGEGSPPFLRARSDLVGVSLDLPAPYGKSPAMPKEMIYEATFAEGEREIGIRFEGFESSLSMLAGTIRSGTFYLGERRPEVEAGDGVVVAGDLDVFRLDEWLELTRDLAAKFEEHSNISLESEVSKKVKRVSLDVDVLEAFGAELSEVDLTIDRRGTQWHARMQNENIKGTALYDDSGDGPLEIDLAFLRLKSNGTPGLDPLAEIDPRTIREFRFRTDEFSLDGEDYGAWSFTYQPREDGARLTDLEIFVKQLEVGGGADEEAEPSYVIWQQAEGRQTSRFEGKIRTDNLAAALEEWGFAASVESEDVELSTELSWDGSPAMFDVETVTGDIKVDVGKGRFVQAQKGSGALRLLGIFDFTSIARRFRFDFSDVVDSGFVFDHITGNVHVANNVIEIRDPMEIGSPGSTLKVGGLIDLGTQGLDNDMVVTLPLSRNLPWFAAIASGPLFGAGVFLAERLLLEDPINQVSSAKYKIEGTIDDPVISFVSIFDNEVRSKRADAEGGQAP